MAEAICEKCIHYEMCKAEMDLAPDDTFTFFPYNEDCPHFKNKADFVEVVRCKDCEKENRFDCPLCYIEKQTLQFINHNADFYCGYGKRKVVE